MKKILWILLPCLLAFWSSANAVALRTLKWATRWDVDSKPIVQWEHSIFNIISLVNNYVRFTIGLACFWFMIWNGYQLIMARGDSKQMDTATKSLVWCALWLVVCILAHIIVNIAVKLLA